MGLIEKTDRCADLRGMYGQTFCCEVECHGEKLFVVMECGRPCVDVSHPFLVKLLSDDPENFEEFLAEVVDIAREMEYQHLAGMTQVARSPALSDVPTNKHEGHVYVIRGENGRYKIGRTKNLNNRMSSIKTSSPMLFSLTHSFRTANTLFAEKMLHERFQPKRRHGEWFDLEKADVAWLRDVADFALDGDSECQTST